MRSNAALARRRGGVFCCVLLSALTVVWLTEARAADVFVATAGGSSGRGALLGSRSDIVRPALPALHTRVRLRFQDNRVYILQGEGRDQLLVLIPSAWLAPAIEFSTGPGSDPWDVVALPDDELYISLHGGSEVVRVDAYSGEVQARIDLSALDTDGNPDMTKMIRRGDRLYVLCERLGAPTGTIAVIDMRTESALDMEPATPGLQGLELGGLAPTCLLGLGERLIVPTSEGIEELDPVSRGRRVLLTAAELGGVVQGIALRSNRQGYAAVQAGEAFHVVPVDLLARTAGAPLTGLTGGRINDLVIDDNRLIVADDGTFEFDFAAGLYIYDVDTGSLLAGPIDTGQKPKRLVVVAQRTITAVESGVGQSLPATSRLLIPFPNPFNAGVVLPLQLHSDTKVRLTIHNLAGMRVRTLLRGSAAPGGRSIRWDGRDDGGRAVASGVYFARLLTGAGTSTRRLVLVR